MSEIDARKIGEHYEISYIIFKDSKGKEHLIAKETIELWKKTFKLKSIDDEYIPNIPQKLKDFLGKDKIFIGKSTLFTLVAKQYHNAIPQVKQMLESPNEIIITNSKSQSLHYEDYILAKFINDKAYFLNMRIFESGDCLVSISNGRKKLKEFKKNIEKLKQLDKKEVVYKQSMVGTPTSYIQAQSLDERLVDNNISLTADSIIANSNTQSQTHKSNNAKISQDKQKSNTNEISM